MIIISLIFVLRIISSLYDFFVFEFHILNTMCRNHIQVLRFYFGLLFVFVNGYKSVTLFFYFTKT